MALQPFSVARDNAGNNTLIPMGPQYVDNYVLVAGAAQNIVVPVGAAYAIIGQNNTAAFYLNFNGVTAAVPGATLTTGAGVMIRMTDFQVPNGVTGVSVVADAATVLSVAWYKAT